MLRRSYERGERTKWTGLFYACRSAIRTPVGLGVAEYVLPLLVLERVCYGDGHDDHLLLAEIQSVLTFGKDVNCVMGHSERQKAVSTVLDLIDTLQFWLDQETESRRLGLKENPSQDNEWPLDVAILRIADIMRADSTSLSLRATAASIVGMHARALRLFEMLSRSQSAEAVFDGKPPRHEKSTRSRAVGVRLEIDTEYMKESLSFLHDYDTLACLTEDEMQSSQKSRLWSSIKQKEAVLDWETALQEYERAIQLQENGRRDPGLQTGALRCMLELGHFDSVIKQVEGLLYPSNEDHNDKSIAHMALPFAIEASWRLGDWDYLSTLVNSRTSEDGRMPFPSSQGMVLLSLHDKNLSLFSSRIKDARRAVMEKLSISATEGHFASYPHLVQLHTLRETEDIAEAVCGAQAATALDTMKDLALYWDGRLESVHPAGIAQISNTRLALSRLAGSRAYECDLFLSMAKRARKNGLNGMAASALAQAEAAFHRHCLDSNAITRSTLLLQFAKLKHSSGEVSAALRMLQNENIEVMAGLDDKQMKTEALNRVCRMLVVDGSDMHEDKALDVFAKCTLQATKWMIEGGLKGGSEVLARFRVLDRLVPKWEKGNSFDKPVSSVK